MSLPIWSILGGGPKTPAKLFGVNCYVTFIVSLFHKRTQFVALNIGDITSSKQFSSKNENSFRYT